MNEWVPARCRQWLTNGDRDSSTISPTFLFNSPIHLHTYPAKLAAREKHYLWKLSLKLWGCKMFFELLMVFKREKCTASAAEQNQHVAASQEGTAMAWCEGFGWQWWSLSAALGQHLPALHGYLCPTATAVPHQFPRYWSETCSDATNMRWNTFGFSLGGNLK